MLRYYLGLSTDETARVMGISPGTVKSAVSRAIAARPHAQGGLVTSVTAGATTSGRIDYQLKAAQATDVGVLWTSPSAGTLIGVWGTDFSLGQATPLNFGVISHGTFTPLRLPSSLTSTRDSAPFPIAF